jgi:RNA polymerase sigma-70 factor (ECF subfamily)
MERFNDFLHLYYQQEINEMGELGYPEEKLVKRCQKGDESAFRILVENYRDLLLGTAYLILKNRQSADEVVQETVIKMWENLPSLRDSGSLKPWLMRIVINEANRQFRKKSISTVSLESAPEIPDDDYNIDELLIQEENHQMLREALSSLSPEQREVIVLRYFSDLTVPEIAAAVSIPEGTVKSRLSRALDRLYMTVSSIDNPTGGK